MKSDEVCVVDDDPCVLKAVGRLLLSANLAAKEFSDPQQFLHYSRSHTSALAVIDVYMPGMNGLEVQSRLREISPSTQVIIFSGKQSELTRVAALRAGALAFFTKPFDNDEFLAAVDAALTDSQNTTQRSCKV